jgi:TRAP-type C4-dicarboxylate transport system permease small subunit
MNEAANETVIDIADQLAKLGNPFKITAENFSQFLSNIISTLLIVAVLAFFFYFILGGFQYIISSGEKTAVEEAKNKITYAFIGFIIVAIAWAVLKLITYFFGIEGVTQ